MSMSSFVSMQPHGEIAARPPGAPKKQPPRFPSLDGRFSNQFPSLDGRFPNQFPSLDGRG